MQQNRGTLCGTLRGSWIGSVLVLLMVLGLMGRSAPALAQSGPAASPAPTLTLRVVGGLDGLHQYTRIEEPFWTRELRRLSGGRYAAEIVPFDRAGIRGPEFLPMVRLGTVPFGTLLVSTAAPKDAELTGLDLAGLNPDGEALRRTVQALRPRLKTLLKDRHNAELLAVYIYPAQVLFCATPLRSLEDLRGKRVRTSSVTQSDWVEALGGQAVSTRFAEIVENVKAGNMDCAITGTMSGNTIGLHEITTHLHPMPVNWGVSLFIAHAPSWQALPDDLRRLLQRELPRLEKQVWDEALQQTGDGVQCNTGQASCRGGRRGSMALVPATPQDERLRRQALEGTVLPRWLQRCGPECGTRWNELVGALPGAPAARP
jgi:TRAP-type C4-dicarboxylate transport system substrate-binding protein